MKTVYLFKCKICGKVGQSTDCKTTYCVAKPGEKRSKCYKIAKKRHDRQYARNRRNQAKIANLGQCEGERVDPDRNKRIKMLTKYYSKEMDKHGPNWVEESIGKLF